MLGVSSVGFFYEDPFPLLQSCPKRGQMSLNDTVDTSLNIPLSFFFAFQEAKTV